MVSDYDPLIILNEKIRMVSDSYQLLINQVNILLNHIINQTKNESETRKEYCEICNIKNVRLQGHHLAGRYHDFRQITVCTECHNILTSRQKLDARIWTGTSSEFLKTAFFYKGLHDVLILMSEKRQNSLYAYIADSLVNTIFSLQKSAGN